ncbi:PEGA domain-containing protein [Spirosoma areae]
MFLTVIQTFTLISCRRLLLQIVFVCGAIGCYAQTERRGVTLGSLTDTTGDLRYTSKYALLIGIDNYETKSGFAPLHYAVNDARALQKVLIERLRFPAKNIRLLLNKEATRRNIQNALESFSKDEVFENSQLVVFFAGHGTTTGRAGGNRRRGFLVPADGSDGELNASALAMDELRQQADFIRPKHTLFLVDACYGGLAQARSGIPTVAFIRNVWNQRCREIITAGSADETVIESDEWQHSAFTKVLLDALERGEADINGDNVIVSSELFGYIQQRVPYYAQQKGGRQTPQFSTLTPETGTFLWELTPNALADSRRQNFIPSATEINRKFNSTLAITANVPNARVKIDSVEVGYLSNGKFNFSTAPGYYRVELLKDKFDSETKEIEVRPDTTVTLPFTLTQKVFDVTLSVDPADAVTYVDNRLVGAGAQKVELEKGRHIIAVSKGGYLTRNEVVELVQETTLNVALEKIKASVDVVSTPPGATVSENGHVVGQTPLRFNLDYGLHKVDVSKEDYLPHNLTVDVREPSQVTQTIALEVDPNGRLMRRLVLDKLNRRLAANFGVATLTGLSAVYLDKLIRDNRQNSTFLTQTDDQQKRGYWQTAKYVSLAICSLELVSSFLNVAGIVRFQQRKPISLSVNSHPSPAYSGLSICYTF